MTDANTDAERILALIDAHGADPARWPAADRAAHARAPAAAVEDARALDALLDASPRPWPSAALRDRVLASALEAGLGATGRARRWSIPRLAWLSGAGWAAAACAGMAAGLVMTVEMTENARADATLYQSALIGVDDTQILAETVG